MRFDFTSACVLLVAALAVGTHATSHHSRKTSITANASPFTYPATCSNKGTPKHKTSRVYCNFLKRFTKGKFLDRQGLHNDQRLASDIAFHVDRSIHISKTLVDITKDTSKSTVSLKVIKKSQLLHYTTEYVYKSTRAIVEEFWVAKPTKRLNKATLEEFGRYLNEKLVNVNFPLAQWMSEHDKESLSDHIQVPHRMPAQKQIVDIILKFFDTVKGRLRDVMIERRGNSKESLYPLTNLEEDLRETFDDLKDYLYRELYSEAPLYHRYISQDLPKDLETPEPKGFFEI